MALNTSFTWSPANNAPINGHGKKTIIFGGTSGIGRAIALKLAAAGTDVTVVGRSFRDQGVKGLNFVPADLSIMAEARRIARELPAESADLLIFTTGIMAGPKREETAEGIERDLAVSFLNRQITLDEIGPRLKPAARVFLMAFPGSGQKAQLSDINSEKSYGRMKAHSTTVAANEALTLEAVRRYPNVDVFGLNPGFVDTGIRHNLFGGRNWILRVMETVFAPLTAKPEDYVNCIVGLLFAPELNGKSGLMFNNKGRAILPSKWTTEAGTAEVMTATRGLLARKGLA
jgi:NAD(P)-dependent dehydrogenase (short-subunit alcohol dehydrogenase family)